MLSHCAIVNPSLFHSFSFPAWGGDPFIVSVRGGGSWRSMFCCFSLLFLSYIWIYESESVKWSGWNRITASCTQKSVFEIIIHQKAAAIVGRFSYTSQPCKRPQADHAIHFILAILLLVFKLN